MAGAGRWTLLLGKDSQISTTNRSCVGVVWQAALGALAKENETKTIKEKAPSAAKREPAADANAAMAVEKFHFHAASPSTKARARNSGARAGPSGGSGAGSASWWSVTKAQVNISQSAISTEHAPAGMITPIRSNGRPATLTAVIVCDNPQSAASIAALLVHQPADQAVELMFELRYADTDALIVPNVTSRANDWIMVKNPMGDNDKQLEVIGFNLTTATIPKKNAVENSRVSYRVRDKGAVTLNGCTVEVVVRVATNISSVQHVEGSKNPGLMRAMVWHLRVKGYEGAKEIDSVDSLTQPFVYRPKCDSQYRNGDSTHWNDKSIVNTPSPHKRRASTPSSNRSHNLNEAATKDHVNRRRSLL